MNFSEFFTSKDNIQLDKKTLVILRWIALVGQYLTISIVFFIFKFELPFFYCSLVILIGLLTNLYLQFKFNKNQLNNFASTFFLFYDLIQLSLLLYLTRWYNKSLCNFINCSCNSIFNFFKFKKYNKFVRCHGNNFNIFNYL